MPQSSTLYVGLDVHQQASAVAYIAQAHDGEVVYPGTIGTRQCDIETLIRTLQSKSRPLVLVYAAGPCGSWLSRYHSKKGAVCWVMAPSLIPQKAGDRVNTATSSVRQGSWFHADVAVADALMTCAPDWAALLAAHPYVGLPTARGLARR